MKRERSEGGARPPAREILWVLMVAAFALTFCGCSRVKPMAMEKSDCLRSGYDRYTYYNPTNIPDNIRSGITIGPLPVAVDGGRLETVILRVAISHRSPADLDLRLVYDVDNDGKPDASAPVEFYRGRADGCISREPYACPRMLQGVFWFKGDAPGGLDRTFDVFAGLPSGGSFYLDVADTLAKDLGSVANWSVYVQKSFLMAAR